MNRKRACVVAIPLLLLIAAAAPPVSAIDPAALQPGGGLVLTSTPTGASVLIDDTDYSTTPLGTERPADSQTLKLTLAGYQDYEETIEIVVSETLTKEVILTAVQPSITDIFLSLIDVQPDDPRSPFLFQDSKDPARSVLSLKTGAAARVQSAVTVSNTQPGTLYRVTVDPDTLPVVLSEHDETPAVTYKIAVQQQGASVEQAFCEVTAIGSTATCTFTIDVTTIEAGPDQIFAPLPMGTVPGRYDGAFTVRLEEGDSVSKPFALEITSGEVVVRGWVSDNVDKEEIEPTSNVEIPAGERRILTFMLKGFPSDVALTDAYTKLVSSLPSSVAASFYDPLDGDGKIMCTKTDLQKGCEVWAHLLTQKETPAGTYAVAVTVNDQERFSFLITITQSGIEVTDFRPLYFDKRQLSGSCTARIDPAIIDVNQLLSPPSFTLTYVDEGIQLVSIGPLAGKLVKPNEYRVEVQVPPWDSNGPTGSAIPFLQARCKVDVTTQGQQHSSQKIITEEKHVHAALAELPDGNIVCKGRVDSSFLAALSDGDIKQSNFRMVISIRDKNNNLFKETDGSVLIKPLEKIASTTGDLFFRTEKLSPFLQPGEKFRCRVRLEVYDWRDVRTTAPASLTFTDISERPFDQRCETFTSPGYGGEDTYTVQFIGVGGTKEAFDALIAGFLAAIKDDPVFAPYTSLFSLRKVVYPWPLKAEGEDYYGALRGAKQGGAKLKKYCPSDYTVYLGESLYGGGKANWIQNELILVESPVKFATTARHETAHLWGKLRDEYTTGYERIIAAFPDFIISPFLQRNCRPTTTITSNGREVCPEWAAYPDYAACLPGCTILRNYRSVENSLMAHSAPAGDGNKFSIVQCAWLVEQLEKLRDPSRSVEFDRGMQHCIDNRVAFNLVWQAAGSAGSG